MGAIVAEVTGAVMEEDARVEVWWAVLTGAREVT